MERSSRKEPLPRYKVKGYVPRPLSDDVIVKRSTKRYIPQSKRKVSESKKSFSYETSKKVSMQYVVPKKNYKSLTPQHANRLNFKKSTFIYTVTALLVIVAIALNALQLFTAAKPIQDVQAQQNDSGKSVDNTDKELVTNTISDVDETKPIEKTVRNYTVASDLPRFLNIPAIGVYAKVLRIGTNNSNEILTPKNIYNAGWYEGSSKPGEPGAVFINGHVSGPTSKGVFFNLKKLNLGDELKLEKGDANLITYRVVHKEIVPTDQVNMKKVLRSFDIDKQGLNIMTCGGEFDKNSDTFNKRVIIYAVKV